MLRIVACAAATLLIAMVAAPAAAADAVLYRIFLKDGATLVSYGEFSRVADRVVFSVPVGSGESDPPLQLVSIPQAAVNWEMTDKYVEAARARRYAETRGEYDFTMLSAQVARALNDAAHVADPLRRLDVVERARKTLLEWPANNYAYRAADVAQIGVLLDEVVSELRVAAGKSSFDLAMVANPATPTYVPLLPPPTLRESIEIAFTTARLTEDSEARVALLTRVNEALTQPIDESWAAPIRARAKAELRQELRTNTAYARLAKQVLTTAESRVARADVRGVERLIQEVMKADDKLGRARPSEIASLLATLDARVDAARRLRLARDAWAVRTVAVNEYRERIRRPLRELQRLQPWLEDVRALAGPSVKNLEKCEERARTAGRELSLVKPPVEIEAAHGMLTAAATMAARAASERRAAVKAGDMQGAWGASSAAAGALLMIEQALTEMTRALEPPQSR